VSRVVDAPLDRLARLRQLQQDLDDVRARRLSRVDAFKLLGFSPNCAVQHDAVRDQLLAAGVDAADVEARTVELLRDPRGAAAAGVVIPPRCGGCPQERFIDLPDQNMDVLYGGAGGGGKSHALLMLALRACTKYPGMQVFWFRRSFPELNQSVLRLLARMGHARVLGARWDGSKYELRFANRSVLTFGHAKNLQEASALSSAEINLLILDERTTIPPDVVEFLYTRVRSGTAGVPCLGVRSASNPGFVGHRVVKEGWVDATDNGAIELVDKAGRRRIFIPAKVSDNPMVGDYAEALKGISDPDLRRRILDGDWQVMPDGAFPDWHRHNHIDADTGQQVGGVVVPAFEPPPSWPRTGGLDYGWTAPSVYELAARDPDGRLWVYRELVMVQVPEQEQARRIAALEDAYVGVRAADPAMWGRTGSALPPASQFAIAGTPLSKADNDRFGGKQRVHQYLALAPACAHHRAQGLALCPMVHVMESGCPELIKTMESLPRDTKRPEDVDTEANDHAYDSFRYLCMAVGTAPQMIFDDDVPLHGVVDRGGIGFAAQELTIPAHTPTPETPGVANPAAWREPEPAEDWSQV
jgi:hypothetical protein